MKHPRGLYLLFVTEMWERFSYYGMRAIFVLFLLKALLFRHEDCSNIYGSFTGLVYLTPLLGGYIADRYWGNRRSIVVGGFLMSIGQFFLFLSSTFYQTDFAVPLMFAGLFFLVVGNGFFKPNISTMVGQLYPANDSRIDSAYTIFYMGINLGAFFSPLICGTLGDTNDPADFRWGFLAACIGMLVGLACFITQKNKYLVTPEGAQIGCKPAPVIVDKTVDDTKQKTNFTKIIIAVFSTVILFAVFYWLVEFDIIASLIFSACIVIPVFIVSDSSLTSIERSRILVIYILAFFVIFFWAAYEQAGNAITLFTEEQTNRFIGDYEVNTSYFQSLNPIMIVVLAPVISVLWTFLENIKIKINLCQKQALGILLLSVSYGVLAFSTFNLSPEVKVGMYVVVLYYFISTVGELSLSPVGLSMVTKLSPARFASLLMGVWLMSTAAANKFCGMLGALYPSSSSEDVTERSFLGYQITSLSDFFILFVAMTLLSSVILFALSGKLEKMMHSDEENS